MNIFVTDNFVAGIFKHWTDAQRYLISRPTGAGCLLLNSDLTYPFYLVETDKHQFIGVQTEMQARAQRNGIVLYTVYCDYQPDIPWTDMMGRLEHEHMLDIDP